MRLVEAEALLDAGYPSGAYYLAGYAVECGLKACIARRTQRHDFPDKRDVDASWTHNLMALVKAANLESALEEYVHSNLQCSKNWGNVKQWSERSRYEKIEVEQARAFIRAVGSRKYSVLSWIKRHW